MDDTMAQRVEAGLTLRFAAGERPDAAALRAAVAACQAQASVIDEGQCIDGTAQVIASGLVFELDGLSPAAAGAQSTPVDRYGFSDASAPAAPQGVRLYPGHHLSGGVALAPVTRALLALAAELAIGLPARAVHWHPANTLIEPSAFSRSVLAWLAGGAFPAHGLTALIPLADASVISRGLAHFVGQEMSLRSVDGAPDLKLAAHVVDRLVQSGPLTGYTEWRFQDRLLCAEPARQARQILVWQA